MIKYSYVRVNIFQAYQHTLHHIISDKTTGSATAFEPPPPQNNNNKKQQQQKNNFIINLGREWPDPLLIATRGWVWTTDIEQVVQLSLLIGLARTIERTIERR